MLNRLPALGIAGLGFLLYALTSHPFPDWLDSPELISAACRLGVFHPPGSPLAVMLGYLFSLWPFAAPAASLLYFSAFFTGCALYVLARCVQDLWRALGPSGARLEAVVVTGLSAAFALSCGLWSQAVRTEVYTLGLFLFLCCLRELVRLAHSPIGENSPSVTRAAAFCGMGLCVHPLMALSVAPAIALLAAWRNTRGLFWTPRRLLRSGAAFVLGLAPLLFIPLMARAQEDLRWGDPTTFSGWLQTVLGLTFSHSFSTAQTAVGVKTVLAVGLGLGAGLVVLAALSLYPLFRKKCILALVLILTAAGSALSLALQRSVRLDNPDVFGYALPAMAAMVLLAAGGLAVGARLLFEFRPRLSWLTAALALIVFLTTALIQDWGQRDRSNCQAGRRLSVAALSHLPEGSLAIVGDFNLAFMLEYLIQVEGLRPDVQVLLLRDLDNRPLRALLARSAPRLEARLPTADRLDRDSLEALAELRPVALDAGPHLDAGVLGVLHPSGLLWLVRYGEPPDEDALLADALHFFGGLSPPLCGNRSADPRSADVIAWHAYWQARAAEHMGLLDLARFLAGVAERSSPEDLAIDRLVKGMKPGV